MPSGGIPVLIDHKVVKQRFDNHHAIVIADGKPPPDQFSAALSESDY
jgi:hypothetical protein